MLKKHKTKFACELNKLRIQAGYRQVDLAKKINVTASYMSQLESGTKKPTPRIIRRLSPHLRVTPNHLLKTIGMVEMDLVSTLACHREHINSVMPNISEEQLEEFANYLTYLDFKAYTSDLAHGNMIELLTSKPVMTAQFNEAHYKKSRQGRKS